MRAAARESADRVVRGRDRWLALNPGSASSRIPARRTTGTRSGRSPRSTRRPCRSGTTEPELPDLDAVVVPGGFSYGDYLRCGAIARFSPATAAVCEFAAAGGLVLGICNGFQILCEAGLLPGALLRNESLRFVCRDVALTVERDDLPFTGRCSAGQRLVLPVKHGDGRYVPPAESRPVPGRAALPRQPERLGRRDRRRLQRGGERDRAHAAPGARGRSAARLG